MRVLFSSVPAPSHLIPMLPLARALDARHQVTFATGRALVPVVEDAGFACATVGLDWYEPEAERTFPALDAIALEDRARWWYDEIFLDQAGAPMARDLSALLRQSPADLIVHSQLELGGWAAARAHGVPHVVYCIGGTHTEADLPAMHPRLVELLLAAGADPATDPLSTFGDLFVHLVPESYGRWTPPVPWVRCRPPVPVLAGPLPPRPAALEGSGDQPVVLVTFGTVFNRTPGAFEVVVEALAGLEVHAVVAVGENRDPAELRPVTPNVVVERFVAYDALLPHCDAVICHGGFGTVMASLAHAVPMVILPLSADQPGHAHRCHRLGVAETIPFVGATPGTVRAALHRVLHEPSFATRTEQVRREIMAMEPMSGVVPRIEELVAPFTSAS